MNILYTAFSGKTNSSKVLLDYIESSNKLYLKNSFATSVNQLYKELDNNKYDFIISFGQAPLDVDTVKIETIAKGELLYKTNYDYKDFEIGLKKEFSVLISKDAGNYLCNNIYYHGLKYINDNKLNTKMIFIHIPKLKNISDISKMAKIFDKLVYDLNKLFLDNGFTILENYKIPEPENDKIWQFVVAKNKGE